ncbi:MAG: aminoacyl--tRNA ligase-related protein [Candidatus Paceibacterota bacterium]
MATREEIAAGVGHRFLVLTEQGDELPIDLGVFDRQEEIQRDFPELVKLVNFEVLERNPGVPPPSIKLMRSMELIDYEPASDAGHFRLYPKGALMLKLLEAWAEEIAINRFGAMQIETPILYDWNHPAIRSQGESFHERHYLVHVPYHKEKEFVLRFAGDFGLFCMVSDAQITYRHLPLRIYEYSKSYRYEKSGALVGLRRLRGFSMPDIHSFCTDIGQSWEEYEELYRNYSYLADVMKVEYAIIFRVVDEFYQQYKSKILSMLRFSKKPAVIDILSSMKHYWAVKHEFQGLDSVGGACQVATVQLDVEDAEKYGITFVTKEGNKQGCVICHSSIGALERWIFLVLESAVKQKVPQFPLWLAPCQVKLIPVSEKFVDMSVKLAGGLRLLNVRAEVDDRSESVGNRVRLAEKDWAPYILVIGENEAGSENFAVKKRGSKNTVPMSLDALVAEIRGLTSDMPFRQSTLPVLMSKRPKFFG